MVNNRLRRVTISMQEWMRAMAHCVASDQDAVRQRALALLSVADSVKNEGWDDEVATLLRRAANDLLILAGARSAPGGSEEALGIRSPL